MTPAFGFAQGPPGPRWILTWTRSGSTTVTSPQGTVTSPWPNAPAVAPPNALSAGSDRQGFVGRGSYSASATGTFTFKYSWKNPDGTPTNVPPPHYLNLRITSIAKFDSAVNITSTSQYDATGNGSANNGQNTPEVDSPTFLSGASDNTANRAYVTKDSSSGVVTITGTESANVSITVGPGTTAKPITTGYFYVNCSMQVDVLPHAHPCNYTKTSGLDIGDGVLQFKYAWDSTSGALADLSNCFVGENVVYPGPAGMPVYRA